MGPFQRKAEASPQPVPTVQPEVVPGGNKGLLLGLAAALLVVIVVASILARRRRSYSLRGKHVVVTGGSSGIGKAVALEALQAGAAVTLMARKVPTLEAAKAELFKSTSTDAKVFVKAIDVGSGLAAVEAAFLGAVQAAGQEVDVLVNCAGNSIPGTFEELDPAAFESMMRVNYFGSVYPTRAVVPSMKARGSGRIVFVSSQAGQVGVFGFSAYSPSKFALVGLAQVLRMELQPHGISVSVAYPPDTDTPGFIEENTHKPEETRLISETAGLFKPEVVAGHIVSGLCAGDFSIYTGLDGWMLANLTAGMAPVSSSLEALTQVGLMSLLRLISLFYVTQFQSIVQACKNKREASKKSA